MFNINVLRQSSVRPYTHFHWARLALCVAHTGHLSLVGFWLILLAESALALMRVCTLDRQKKIIRSLQGSNNAEDGKAVSNGREFSRNHDHAC